MDASGEDIRADTRQNKFITPHAMKVLGFIFSFKE